MRNKRSGFTLIELLVVIVIGSILVSISVSTFQRAQGPFAARGGRTMYATLHQRARARAIELGRPQLFVVNTVGDSAFIMDWRYPSPPVRSDITRFREELNVDLRASVSSFMICMTPRGYADPNCPATMFTTTSSPIQLEFWMNADSTSVTILPMGQLVGM
jgi:prepilin-type N-terminal cleavage/methylation domain-containing protein